jgi:hypothetical protein
MLAKRFERYSSMTSLPSRPPGFFKLRQRGGLGKGGREREQAADECCEKDSVHTTGWLRLSSPAVWAVYFLGITMLRKIFQLPSGCLCQTVRYFSTRFFPLSNVASA